MHGRKELEKDRKRVGDLRRLSTAGTAGDRGASVLCGKLQSKFGQGPEGTTQNRPSPSSFWTDRLPR